jgi:histidinol-phosphatase (PHP family)
MPFSHHSHSGQFCGHAKNTLEEMVQKAIGRGMRMYCLTEHMPRDVEDFYPEEVHYFNPKGISQAQISQIDTYPDAKSLAKVSDLFYDEALRLRDKYQLQIKLLIGFESEWIRPSTLPLIRNLQEKFSFDFFVGSVHHVHTVPIDFDRNMYEEARDKAGGTDEKLFQDYFDAQYDMLQKLRPPVVGHFDLIRLLSDDGNRSFTQWESVWSRVLRNLTFVAGYRGVLEINSSALRKGLSEPYPQVEICKVRQLHSWAHGLC